SDIGVVSRSRNVKVAATPGMQGHSLHDALPICQLLGNAVVATFDDINTANVAADFTATIDWGDGTTSAGSVSGSGGTFSVAGTHTDATAGHDETSVILVGDPPGAATTTATNHAI